MIGSSEAINQACRQPLTACRKAATWRALRSGFPGLGFSGDIETRCREPQKDLPIRVSGFSGFVYLRDSKIPSDKRQRH
jgi:hypothetical protein